MQILVLHFQVLENCEKTVKKERKKKKKHNKIVMLARNKLNSIENKISEALVNNKVNHEDFMKIL